MSLLKIDDGDSSKAAPWMLDKITELALLLKDRIGIVPALLFDSGARSHGAFIKIRDADDLIKLIKGRPEEAYKDEETYGDEPNGDETVMETGEYLERHSLSSGRLDALTESLAKIHRLPRRSKLKHILIAQAELALTKEYDLILERDYGDPVGQELNGDAV